MRCVAVPLLLAAALGSGCFAPSYGNGEVACGAAPELGCPPGYECNAGDNRCYRPGTAPDAAPPDASPPDAAIVYRAAAGMTSGGGATGATAAPGTSRAVVGVGQAFSGTTGRIETGLMPRVKDR